MYYIIQIKSGYITWVTKDEAELISQKLLDGEKFVKLDRLNKVFNATEIVDVGPSQIFFDPLVRGGEFSFSYTTVYAKIHGMEFVYNKGWKRNPGCFSLGKPFEEIIKDFTVKNG